MPFIITSYNKDKRNLFAKFSRNVFAADIDGEARLAAFKEYVLDSFDSQKIFYQTLADMETMGVSSFTIKDLLEKRLTRSEIKNLLNGEFKVPGFSEETFEDNINKLNLEDPIQAAKLSSEIRSAIFSMDNLRKSLKFTNFRESRDELDKKINRILYPTIKLFREEPVGIETVEPKAELPLGS